MIRRLTAQNYLVEATADPAKGADMALSEPPAVLISDLWMPTISGVQLCRLLKAEPATADVPVILRGEHDDPRSRFWAERAGAAAYVVKGRMAELVRVLAKATANAGSGDGFFMLLSGGSMDIRDRIASHLDAALFESVIASEVRALASCGSFERLFDVFSQFLSQVINYRWVAVATTDPVQFVIHHHPRTAAEAEAEARAALGVDAHYQLYRIADEDACNESSGASPIVSPIPFGNAELGRLALAPSSAAERDTPTLVSLVARELGGPIRIAALMAESERLATVDALTSLMNRRAFLDVMRVEVERSRRYNLPLSVLLFDVDHFKAINDSYGHAAGDQVLSALGSLLSKTLRVPDSPARWGGEEFVVALKNTDAAGATVVAERIRNAVAALDFTTSNAVLHATVSIGVAELHPSDSVDVLIDRADRAMYAAKVGGRNQVVVAPEDAHSDRALPVSKLAG